MIFSKQESWSGQPFPYPEDLPNPGTESRSPALQADSLPSEPPGKPNFLEYDITICNLIQTHQEIQELGYFVVPSTALSHALFLSASSHTDVEIRGFGCIITTCLYLRVLEFVWKPCHLVLSYMYIDLGVCNLVVLFLCGELERYKISSATSTTMPFTQRP